MHALGLNSDAIASRVRCFVTLVLALPASAECWKTVLRCRPRQREQGTKNACKEMGGTKRILYFWRTRIKTRRHVKKGCPKMYCVHCRCQVRNSGRGGYFGPKLFRFNRSTGEGGSSISMNRSILFFPERFAFEKQNFFQEVSWLNGFLCMHACHTQAHYYAL